MKEKIAARLKRIRISRGLSMRELAERTQIPVSTYREWEYGRAIQGEPYIALAAALEVSVKELLSGESSDKDRIRVAIHNVELSIKELKLEVMSL